MSAPGAIGDQPLELTAAEAAALNLKPGPLVPAPGAGRTLLDVIARAAADPTTDVAKLERLVALYERHTEREAQAAYSTALAVMQPLLPEIAEHGSIKDRSGAVQSTYALWEDIQAMIKPVLAAHGFALNFAVAVENNQLRVTGRLRHREGHVEETTMTLPLDTSGSKNTVQAYGSSTSYGMRYTARALLNLTSRGEDDDGEAGGTKLISEGELESLQALAKRAKVDLARFVAFLKIPSLDQLPARRYRVAERALQDRLAKLPPAPTPPAPAAATSDPAAASPKPGTLV